MVYLLESAICLAVFYAFYWLVLRRQTFFQWNRAFLLLAAAFSMAIPALKWEWAAPLRAERQVAEALPVPQWSEWVREAQYMPVQFEGRLAAPVEQGWSLSAAEALLFLYIIGAAWAAFRLVQGLWRLFRLLRRCRRERNSDCTLAFDPEGAAPLASFFGYVFWNHKDEDDPSQSMLLAHEMAHVRHWHSLDVVLMELMVLLQWFNPLMYAYRRSLRAVHEYIADAWVVRNTQRRYDYALLLAQQAGFKPTLAPPMASTFHSQLKQRLTMLAKPTSRPFQRMRYLLAVPLCAGLFLLFSFRFVEQLPVAAPLLQAETALNTYVTTLDHITVLAPNMETDAHAVETPYIFYWGVRQCRLYENPQTGETTGELHYGLSEFRAAVWQKPFVWDAQKQAMLADVSFQLQDLTITNQAMPFSKSQNNTGAIPWQTVFLVPDNIADNPAARFASFVTKEDRYSIVNLTLPTGKKATISLFFDLPDHPNGSMLVMKNFGGGTDIWSQLFKTKHMTKSQFEERLRQSPVLSVVDSLAGKYILLEMTVLPFRQDPISTTFSHYSASAEDVQNNLKKMMPLWDKIEPGTDVFFNEVDKEGRQLGAFCKIVAPNDPRLEAQHQPNANFRFAWNDYIKDLPMHLWGLSIQDEKLETRPIDKPVKLTEKLPISQVRQWAETPAKLNNNGFPIYGLSFKIRVNGEIHFYSEANGASEPFAHFLKNGLKPSQTLVLYDFMAERTDLRNVTIEVQVVADDDDTALQLSNPSAETPTTGAIELGFKATPNPTQGEVTLSWQQAQAGAARLSLTTADGKVIYSNTNISGVIGELLKPAELHTKGVVFARLQVGNDQVAVQRIIVE